VSGYRKKLIEVALPLEAINKASAREKAVRQGQPSTLHLWWSRKPLATPRAVIFAQMVDDPLSPIGKRAGHPAMVLAGAACDRIGDWRRRLGERSPPETTISPPYLRNPPYCTLAQG
jgi:hypothetical protein